MYILTVFLLIYFSIIMDIFLLLCTSGIFFILNLFILIWGYLFYNILMELGHHCKWQRTKIPGRGTRAMVGWKEPKVQKRRKRFFTSVCERLGKYHLDLFAVIEHVFTGWFPPHFGYFLASLHIWKFYF